MIECTRCHKSKDISLFTKNKSKKNGINTWCAECTKDYNSLYYPKHKEKSRQYAKDNADRIKKRMREYRMVYLEVNKDKIRQKKKEYYERHYKEARREKMALNARKRRAEGRVCKLNRNMSLAVWRSLVYQKKGMKWETLVGYTIDQLRHHLEKQFTEGMTWDNYGINGWEIDHIIPLSIFNINGPESKGFKKAWALNNLRPLWASDNRIKRDKLFAA